MRTDDKYRDKDFDPGKKDQEQKVGSAGRSTNIPEEQKMGKGRQKEGLKEEEEELKKENLKGGVKGSERTGSESVGSENIHET